MDYKWIRSLRGGGALLVYLSHFFYITSSVNFIIGRLAVVAFFIISGFLAPAAREKRSTMQYLFNRFIRMYIIFWLLLILLKITHWDSISTKDFLLNLTLFNGFLGSNYLIGASWMMPIQVVFFGIIGLFWKYVSSWIENDKLFIPILVCSLLSILSGVARFFSNISFPTAFFLLSGIAFFGISLQISKTKGKLILNFVILVLGIVPGILLSYPEMASLYLIAYALGFVFFFLFYNFNIHIKILDYIGNVGFTFFLCPFASHDFVNLITSSFAVQLPSFVDVIIKLLVTYIFAYLITRFIETPLLKWGKSIEIKMNKE